MYGALCLHAGETSGGLHCDACHGLPCDGYHRDSGGRGPPPFHGRAKPVWFVCAVTCSAVAVGGAVRCDVEAPASATKPSL